jgi:pimeloyl-ACP methyl ester carboxylesterase/DNA-binding CsgD family transcriptional regulator
VAPEPTLTLTPRQRIHFCTSHDRVRLAYATTGDGSPLVKAANWLTHLEFDWNSPVWRGWLTELSRDRTLIRYDARGCGLSDWKVPKLSFEAWLNDLQTVVEAAGVKKFALLGMLGGAAVAIAYAARYPERVSRLILHGGFVRGRLKRRTSPEQREMDQAMARLIELGWGKENPAFRQLFTSQFIPDGSPQQHRWFNELQRVSTSPENAARILRVLYQVDATALARKVTCPTLVLHSSGDARVPFEEGRLMASLIPGARFVPLESRNQILLEQEPAWKRWLEEVRAFLPAEPMGGSAFAALTQRELELVELIAQGLDNAQSAAVLSVSEKTVRNHITSIFAKLKVESRAQAIVLARDAGYGKKPA